MSNYVEGSYNCQNCATVRPNLRTPEQMKKIIVTTQDIISPLRGGGGLRTVGTAREFKKRGCNIEILAPSDKKDIEGIPVRPLHKLSKRSSQLLSSLIFVIQLFFALFPRIMNVNLIFVHNSVAGIPSILLSKIFGIYTVMDVTDISTEYLYDSARSWRQKLLFSALMTVEYVTFKYADKIIVVSKVMAKHLSDKGINANKVSVVYDGAEIEQLRLKKKQKDYFAVIHHGSIDLRDNVISIIQAAPFVLKKYPETKFYIVGDGSCSEEIMKRAKEIGVEKSLVFTGWQPYPKMKEYFTLADIGIIARSNTLPNNMVLTLKLLEYWATGTAVVSSRLNGIQEVAEEGKDILFFEPSNAKDLAEKIIELLRNSELIHFLKFNATKKVERFDWSKLTEQIVNISLKRFRDIEDS